MRSKRAKVLHRAGGMALVEHVVRGRRRRATRTHHRRDGPSGRGSGGAARTARRRLRRARPSRKAPATRSPVAARTAPDIRAELLMVLYGDTPLLSAATLQRLRDRQADPMPPRR